MAAPEILDKPNGPVASALLAGGIGSAVMGLVTIYSEMNKGAYGPTLNWYNPVGPLTGKAVIATVAFLLAWGLTYVLWRDKQVNFNLVAIISFILLAIGLLGTFPPVFDLFAGG